MVQPVQRPEPPLEIDEIGMWWLGHASGFWVEGVPDNEEACGVDLVHRCGWRYELDGVTAYVGNMVEPIIGHRRTGCLP